jgi:hypothetical protein
MAASHPYRTSELPPAPQWRESDDVLRGAQSLARLFLVGWSLLRVGSCTARGLDLEGCAALVIVVAMVRSLVNAWSRFS